MVDKKSGAADVDPVVKAETDVEHGSTAKEVVAERVDSHAHANAHVDGHDDKKVTSEPEKHPADEKPEAMPDEDEKADDKEGFVSIVSKRTGSAVAARRRMIIAGIALAVLLVFGGVIWAMNRGGPQASPAEAGERRVLLSDVSEANQAQDYEQEAALLQKYIDSNPPSEFAGDEIIRLGVAYVNAKNYDKAIKTYETAIDTYPDSEFAALRGLAFVYMQRGDDAAIAAENKSAGKADYEKSLGYFRQTLELAKADESKRSGVPADESNIRYLEGRLR